MPRHAQRLRRESQRSRIPASVKGRAGEGVPTKRSRRASEVSASNGHTTTSASPIASTPASAPSDVSPADRRRRAAPAP
jgi:hypothetical protein